MWWVVSRESVASGMVERVVQGIYLLRRLEIVDHEACLHKSAALCSDVVTVHRYGDCVKSVLLYI